MVYSHSEEGKETALVLLVINFDQILLFWKHHTDCSAQPIRSKRSSSQVTAGIPDFATEKGFRGATMKLLVERCPEKG